MTPSRRSWVWKLGLASFLAMSGVIATDGNYAKAQIVPDATLGAERSVVTPNADGVDAISGGATRGRNLFHSFEQFSVLTGRTASFNNAAAIQNIISRVKGGSVSNIDGLLRANGSANLFLINPNGIIFGPNASLNIGGSFVATTANSLKFADGSSFSATAPPTTPLLTISVPLGLQFGGTAADINVNGSGLAVQPGKTLALLGGDVMLSGGDLAASGKYTLEAPEGLIELGSVAENSLVNLSATDSGWNLGYGGVQNFKDIQLSQGAAVNAPVFEVGGGDVQVQARRLTIQDGAWISAPTLGSKPGGTLAVRASDSVELSGTASGLPGGLFTQVLKGATGNGGNLTIETRQLLVRDGAQVSTGTSGVGRSGNLTVKASDSIELSGTVQSVASGLFAQVEPEATGNGGDLRIDTGKLTVLDGAQVSTAARSGGQGGNLTINASDSILLSGVIPTEQPYKYSGGISGLFVSVQPGATRNGGDLTITTGNLTVQDGAAIAANTFGSGRAGNALLNVRQLIIRDGGHVGAASFPLQDLEGGSAGTFTVSASDTVEVSGTTTIGVERVHSTLSTETETDGDAGNLKITTGNLNVRDGGQVTVRSGGSGKAGTLEVQARSISLENLGTLTATTTSGNGGDINLHVQDLLLMRNGSQISTTAGTAPAGGNGGNIDIDTKFIVALPSENSDITANAFTGSGGRINITDQGIFGIEYRKEPTPLSDITASSKFGISGSVNINTGDILLNQGLVELPSAPRVLELIQGCQARGGKPTSRFVNTGRGGLPPNPYQPLDSSEVWRDVQLPRELAENSDGVSRTSTSPTITPDRIVEAQGWIVNKNGNMKLVAKVPTAISQERCDLRSSTKIVNSDQLELLE